MSNQILVMIFGLGGGINPSTLLGVAKEVETAQVKASQFLLVHQS